MQRTVIVILMGFLALGLGAQKVTPTAQAQGEEKTVKVDDFESSLSGWMTVKADEVSGFGVDADSKLSITNDKQQVKAGKGSLFYSYELTPKVMRVLSVQREMNLTGMKSLRFHVKCSNATAIIFGVNEKGGARYQAAVYCPQGTWQEVAINLDELAPDEESRDTNGKLDLDQIESLHITDASSFLASFLPELKGSRVMWLDDMVFSSKPAAMSAGETKNAAGKPVYMIDNFETPVIRWLPLSIELAATPKIGAFDSTLAVDPGGAPGGGAQSLKMTYTRQAMKVHALLRDAKGLDLKKATALNLWLKTSRDGSFIVSLQEKDESRYQQVVELKAGDGWKELTFALSSFNLADDSQDENSKLDADQIKEISIADFTTLLTGGAGVENSLWVDEVRFTLE